MNAKRLALALAVLILTSSALYLVASAGETITPQATTGTTTLVSVGWFGETASGYSRYTSISADGRYVAFESDAYDLVIPADLNGTWDVFVRDLQTGQTTRVSVALDGLQTTGGGTEPSISADGRYVLFESYASNLVSGDTNGTSDVFVRDLQTGQTTRVSVASDGTQGNHYSIASSLSSPQISADGRYVAFASVASNLVSGDTNGDYDIFVHDRQTGQTTRVSVASDGTQGEGDPYADCFGPAISADGRYVAFESSFINLVSGDTNGLRDVFVHDRQTGQTTRVSVASDGTQGTGGWLGIGSFNSAISADGRYVAFSSYNTNLVSGDTNGAVDVFVHDRQTGQTTRVSVASDGTQASGAGHNPISADGRYVAFHSGASNLVSGDTNGAVDVFVHDRQAGQNTRVSVASDGTQGNHESGLQGVSLSADGRYVAFSSDATNLVSGDTNGLQDIFFHDRQDSMYRLYLPLVMRNH